MLDSVNKEDPFEIVKYQSFSLPKKPRSLSVNEQDEEEEEVTIESAFDAAKRNAQEKLVGLANYIKYWLRDVKTNKVTKAKKQEYGIETFLF